MTYKDSGYEWNKIFRAVKNKKTKYINIKTYLDNRYIDSESYKEIIYRIIHNLDIRPVCQTCGGHVGFCTKKSYRIGFLEYCCGACARRNEKVKESCKEFYRKKYGCEYVSQTKEYKEKLHKTCQDRYGTDTWQQSEAARKLLSKINSSEEAQDKSKQTCLEKYGVENVCQCDKIKNKIKQTCLEKYGIEHWTQSNDYLKRKDEIIEKMSKTCQERYGVKFYMHSKEFNEKSKKTNFNRYGNETWQGSCTGKMTLSKIWASGKPLEKRKNTSLKLYGSDSWSSSDVGRQYLSKMNSSDDVRQKTINTNLEKHGYRYKFETPEMRESIKLAMLEKYGVDSYVKTKEFKEKRKKTILNKYGVEHYFQTSEFREKYINTCLEKYGSEYWVQTDKAKQIMSLITSSDEFQKKMIETKLRNGTTNSSKFEEESYMLLCRKFGLDDVLRQHKTKEYPYHADFYIISLKLYIELQGNWTHGFHIYGSSPEDKETLELWNSKKKTKPYYRAAINTWVISDPMKRKTAKDNNLNWIEFWNIDEIKTWISKI